jgi:hypothetical protein
MNVIAWRRKSHVELRIIPAILRQERDPAVLALCACRKFEWIIRMSAGRAAAF